MRNKIIAAQTSFVLASVTLVLLELKQSDIINAKNARELYRVCTCFILKSSLLEMKVVQKKSRKQG